MEIPDFLTIPAIGVALLFQLFSRTLSWPFILDGAIVIGGFFLLQWVISHGTWIGGGDIRLGVLMGLILGLWQGLLALFLAYILGALLSVILLVMKRATRRSHIPLGPFLTASTIVMMFVGDRVVDWYLRLLV